MTSVAAIPESRSTAAPAPEPEQFGLTPEIAVAWLERIVAALEPQGARIWTDAGDGPRPYEEFGPTFRALELKGDDRRRYLALIGASLEGGAGKIAEPRSSSYDALEGGNPTDFTLLVCPLSVDGRNVAVVETWFGDELGRSDQDGAAEKLSKLCTAFRDALSELRFDAARRQTEFAARLAGRLEVGGLAREIVAGVCLLVRADRAVVCRLLHGKWRIIAAADAEGLVSTVDDEKAILQAAEARSRGEGTEIVSGVRELPVSELPTVELPAAGSTPADGDAVEPTDTGEPESGSPVDAGDAVERDAVAAGEPAGDAAAAAIAGLASISYAEHTDVKTAAFLPLVRRTDTKVAQTEFVLIAEWYRRESIDRSLRQLLEDAAPLVERSLDAARRCEALPLRRLSFGWAQLKLRSPLRGVPILLVVAGVAAAVALATLVIPWNHTLAAPGTLRPVVRQGVFAETDGVVDQILVAAGNDVKQGDLLIRMSNPELEIAVADCRKRLAEAEQELRSTERRYNEDRLTDAEARARLPGQIQVLRRRVEGLRSEQAILEEKVRGLVVESPIDGRVVTWDLDRKLGRRPVRRGELLLHVADPNQAWEAEIRLPQRRFGELSAARRDVRPELAVDLSPTSEPALSFPGRLTRVDQRADIHQVEEGSVVLLAAEAEVGPWSSKQDGAEVRARIHCGRRSLGYVLFRDAVDWLHSTWFYLFPF